MVKFDTFHDFVFAIGVDLPAHGRVSSLLDHECEAVLFNEKNQEVRGDDFNGVTVIVPKGVSTFFNGRRGVRYSSKKHNVSNFVLLVDHTFPDDGWEGFPRLVVDSVFDVVSKISLLVSSQEKGKLISVTGTVGKTSVKRMLKSLLRSEGTVGCPTSNAGYATLENNFNCRGYDYRVFEVAAHALNLSPSIVSPDIAVLTSVGDGHSEKYGSFSEISRIKSRIFHNLRPGGTAIINRDIPSFESFLDSVPEGASVVTYGVFKSADARLLNYDASSDIVTASIKGEEVVYRLPLLGVHNAVNSLACIAVMLSLGFKLDSFLNGFSKVKPVRGRGATFSIVSREKRVAIIDDCYNANPLSMSASLDAFSTSYSHASRKVLVIGDMLELGDCAREHHERLAGKINNGGFDKVYLVGSNMAHLWPLINEDIRSACLSSHRHVFPLLRTTWRDGDVVLFKSSNGVGLNKVIAKIKARYEVVSHV